MRDIVIIVASLIIGAWLIAAMSPERPSSANLGHLTSVAAGLVHRERALLEMLNKKGYLTADEVTTVRQMQ